MNKWLKVGIATLLVTLVGSGFTFAILSRQERKAAAQSIQQSSAGSNSPNVVSNGPVVTPPLSAAPGPDYREEAYVAKFQLFRVGLLSDQTYVDGVNAATKSHNDAANKAADAFTEAFVAKDAAMLKQYTDLKNMREAIIAQKLLDAKKDAKKETYIPGNPGRFVAK